MKSKYKDLLTLSVELSLKAGSRIMDIYSDPSKFNVETKNDKSPVTEADKQAHHVIVEGLKNTSIPIISEEGELPAFELRSSWEEFWLIDPLDGTKEFIKRNGDFTVNIALIANGTPLLGVVYSPVHESLYFAEVGVGAWKISSISEAFYSKECLQRAETLPLRDDYSPFTVLLSRSHMTDATFQWVEDLRVKEPDLQTIHAGSSLKSCIIAEGNAHIHPRLGNTMEWDTGAAHAVVKASGKEIVDFHTGEPLKYNSITLVNPWFIVK